MNREQRRKALKDTPAYRRGASAEDLIRRMSKNGITPQEYDRARQKEREEGWHEGYQQGCEETIKMAYAAFCLALNDVYGFGQKRCLEALLRADSILTTSLHSSETIQEVWDKMGLELEFSDPIERVKISDKD